MAAENSNSRYEVQQLLGIVIRNPIAVLDLSMRELDLTLRLTRRVRLLGRLAENLETAGLLKTLPTTAVDQLSSAMTMANSRSRVALWELDRIAWAMHSVNSTPLIVLKGCTYILLDLPNAVGRVFADVDLMTTEEQLEGVEATLNSKGWVSTSLTPYDQNYYRKWTHELPPLVHEEREVEIDLHHNIVPRTARLKPSSARLIDRSRQLPNSRYRVLSNEDIVLHAMTHLMFDSDLADKLRDLVDISDLLGHFSNEDSSFWKDLIDRAVELDLTRPAFYSIRYVHLLLKTPIPQTTLEATKIWAPPRFVIWLMDRMAPRALYPQHPDRASRATDLCRLLLYMRSHWIRMPTWLLVYHLGQKFVRTRLWHRNAN